MLLENEIICIVIVNFGNNYTKANKNGIVDFLIVMKGIDYICNYLFNLAKHIKCSNLHFWWSLVDQSRPCSMDLFMSVDKNCKNFQKRSTGR